MLSIDASKQQLRALFSNPSKDVITVEEAYIADKRNLEEKVKNRTWLKNKMTRLKERNLLQPVYNKKDNVKILIGIELTEEGKKLLGSSKENHHNNKEIPFKLTNLETTYESIINNKINGKVNNNEISLKEILITISKLREETHQNFEAEVKLKEGTVLIRVV